MFMVNDMYGNFRKGNSQLSEDGFEKGKGGGQPQVILASDFYKWWADGNSPATKG